LTLTKRGKKEKKEKKKKKIPKRRMTTKRITTRRMTTKRITTKRMTTKRMRRKRERRVRRYAEQFGLEVWIILSRWSLRTIRIVRIHMQLNERRTDHLHARTSSHSL
jgi:hypothetical protein